MRLPSRFLLVGLVLLIASPSFAGIGFHIGFDMATVEARTKAFVLPDDQTTMMSTEIVREESGQPFNVGVDLTFNMLPIIDFQLSIEAAFASYDVVVNSLTDPGVGSPVRTELMSEEGVPYMRLGGDISALYSLFGFPAPVRIIHFQVGGGLSFQAITPVVSQELLEDNVDSVTEIPGMDITDLADDIEMKFGFHIIGAVKIKPPALPLAFRVQAKYYVFTGAAEDTPDSYLNIQAGIQFGF